jgi:hypothetical protein
MYVKLPKYLFFYDFDADKFITLAIGRAGALKISTFWGPNATCFAQKSLDFQGPPFQWPLLWMSPTSESLLPALHKQQVH